VPGIQEKWRYDVFLCEVFLALLDFCFRRDDERRLKA
jgi:hypothetical protein